jgi:hypothetical protein
MNTVKKWMEITAVLIALYLILTHGNAFSAGVRAVSGAYNSAVANLQGHDKVAA